MDDDTKPTAADIAALAGRDPLGLAMEEMRQTMFDTWRVFREHAALPYGANEHERRETCIQAIKEHLEFRRLDAFDSQHLSFLELLFAYWREMEIEANAPEPDRQH